MAYAMVPIFTQTANGSASEITFNNIPATYTDLMVVISARAGIAAVSDGILAKFNGSVSNFSVTSVQGDGSSASSGRTSGGANCNIARTNGSSATANTYASSTIYIPNYTASVFKQVVVETSSETNGTTTYQNLYALLWRDNSAINSISFPQNSGTAYTNQSTFTLYGIKNA